MRFSESFMSCVTKAAELSGDIAQQAFERILKTNRLETAFTDFVSGGNQLTGNEFPFASKYTASMENRVDRAADTTKTTLLRR